MARVGAGMHTRHSTLGPALGAWRSRRSGAHGAASQGGLGEACTPGTTHWGQRLEPGDQGEVCVCWMDLHDQEPPEAGRD